MKIMALHNSKGRILAAVVIDGQYNGPIPVASANTAVGTFEVPASFSRLPLDEIAKNLRVDARLGRLVDAKSAKGKRSKVGKSATTARR
jgi:hypothetical protein